MGSNQKWYRERLYVVENKYLKIYGYKDVFTEIMKSKPVVSRWETIDLEKITEMVSRKRVVGQQQTIAQCYMKSGTYVPVHTQASEQMIYVLQGAIRVVVDGTGFVVGEGEVVQLPAKLSRHIEVLEDTFHLEFSHLPEST